MKRIHAIPLGGAVEFQTGFTLRGDAVKATGAPLHVLSAASISGGRILPTPPRQVGEGVSIERYLVFAGDIFFKSRGAGFEAAIVDAVDAPAVFAAPLIRLRPDLSQLDPAYLVWFLNSEPVQADIDLLARGSVVRSIGPSELRLLEIPLPPLSLQRQIATLEGLRRREAELLEALAIKRKRFVDARLFAAAAGIESMNNKSRKTGALA